VITSGKDGIYPKGLRLGVVHAVYKDPVDLFLKIEVKPLVRLSALEEVLIIKRGGAGFAVEEEAAPAGIQPETPSQTQTGPLVRPQASPAAKPVAKPVTKPVAKPPAKPPAQITSKEKPPAKPQGQIAPKEKPPAKPQPKPAQVSPKSKPQGQAKPKPKPPEKPQTQPQTQPQGQSAPEPQVD